MHSVSLSFTPKLSGAAFGTQLKLTLKAINMFLGLCDQQ